ncbi:diguanylate cyclase domain-containing protein [Alkalilimnicola ehrlichii MLHE-1]|uniref:Diguanylate cyclase with PAS/PAC sensor n=1 Tax=Alkalilimnicola ehrlichii (strain ATCC BAA-1101 / DSM 17681 / MLHE-1) TaxID=187272 RepID=Q0A7L2_ALKEH|nr:diguanylate cyclase [Alkalilimnicola ehrlichii]ABI57175.1 diguanylate cyclase with PAS/PAC sensor [Alkalilimnicola ehrlichii MLHE-1]
MGLTFQEPLLEALPEAVVWVRPDGRIGYLNPRASQLTGWPVANARGQPLGAVLHLEEQGQPLPPEALVAQCRQLGQAGERHARLRRQDGETLEVALTGAPIQDGAGQPRGVILSFRDIGDYLKMARRLTYEASHDGLTGLVNRREALRRLERMVASAGEQCCEHALCYLDLDRFKGINDLAGHVAGDRALAEVAGRLLDCVRQRDTVARLGGDEFLVLLEHCPLLQAIRVAQVIRAAVRDYRFHWRGQTLGLGVSIGLVPVLGHGPGAEALLEVADQACYEAKRSGGIGIRVRSGRERSTCQAQEDIGGPRATITG